MTPAQIRLTLVSTLLVNKRKRVLRLENDGLLYTLFRLPGGVGFALRVETIAPKER